MAENLTGRIEEGVIRLVLFVARAVYLLVLFLLLVGGLAVVKAIWESL